MTDAKTPAATNPKKDANGQGSKVVRYVGLVLIFIAFSIAAAVLGGRFALKHKQVAESNRMGVNERWGGAINQYTPLVDYFFAPAKYNKDGEEIVPADIQYKVPASDIDAKISLSYRKRGQMEFPGYEVQFNGSYVIGNPFEQTLPVHFSFSLPFSDDYFYDYSSGMSEPKKVLIQDLVVKIDGEVYTGDQNFSNGIDWSGYMAPGDTHVVSISYVSRGLGDWLYRLDNYQDEITNFKLKLTSDFADIDYPESSMTPSHMTVDEDGNTAEIVWEFSNTISGHNIGVTIPRPLDVGKATSNVLFFVPLALIFFLGLILVVTSIKGTPLHPMHYLLITGGFFVFHILMSYLVVLVPLAVAFLISVGASALMTLGYSALIRKGWPVLVASGLGLIFFQIGFSLAQYFPQVRGLVLALIIISGLGLVMAFTARVDWKGKL